MNDIHSSLAPDLPTMEESAFMRADIVKWKNVVQTARIRAD